LIQEKNQPKKPKSADSNSNGLRDNVWRVEYKTDRSNSALKNKTPEMFAKMYEESLKERRQP
jgi:hypothetical protein